MPIPANSLTSVRKVNNLDGLFSVYADRAQLLVSEHMEILTGSHLFNQKWMPVKSMGTLNLMIQRRETKPILL
jgi:hypothetical protein